ncbi:hypothetical protein GF378_00655 [Candidatus Pacearchaeota archaeon]|nr:hypothetical protein [Candidatus Pacearchaeota archaeon]
MTNTNTEEEISPERKKELAREGSLMNLNDRFLSGIGAYGIANATNPNGFGDSLKYLMAYAADKSPSQEAYEKSGLKSMIQTEKPYGINDALRSKCTNIIADSIKDLQIRDVLGIRSDSLKDVYEGRENEYISDLEEDEQKEMIGLYQRPFVFQKMSETYSWMIEQEDKIHKAKKQGGIEGLIENLSSEERERFEEMLKGLNN